MVSTMHYSNVSHDADDNNNTQNDRQALPSASTPVNLGRAASGADPCTFLKPGKTNRVPA